MKSYPKKHYIITEMLQSITCNPKKTQSLNVQSSCQNYAVI